MMYPGEDETVSYGDPTLHVEETSPTLTLLLLLLLLPPAVLMVCDTSCAGLAVPARSVVVVEDAIGELTTVGERARDKTGD